MLLEFFRLWGTIYIAMIGVYFATGLVLSALNARNPTRRIQGGRRGESRARVEIGHSLIALLMSAALLAGGYFAQTQGWTPTPMSITWWSFAIWFVVALLIFDAWFYFGHRILHMDRFYPFHALHHKSVAPTVWSNDSSTLIDTFIEHSFYLVIWFILPVPALSIFALRLFDQISGMVGHSGFEYFASRSSRYPSPMICSTYHDLHHSQFRYNFGNIFSIWDRLFGTIHPDYDRMVHRMENGVEPAAATARKRT